jgi:AbrB family looped-hinge helix DNA binding protein
MKTKMTEKGQITVPKAVRERLGLRPGDQLDVDEENGRLVARKLSPVDPVTSIYGTLKLNRSTDELMRELRGDPDAV